MYARTILTALAFTAFMGLQAETAVAQSTIDSRGSTEATAAASHPKRAHRDIRVTKGPNGTQVATVPRSEDHGSGSTAPRSVEREKKLYLFKGPNGFQVVKR